MSYSIPLRILKQINHECTFAQFTEAGISSEAEYTTYFCLCANDPVNHFSLLQERCRSSLYIMIVFSRGCRLHLPLSAALFPSQRKIHLPSLCSSLCPDFSKGNRRKAGIPLVLFFKKMWLCYTWHNGPGTSPRFPFIHLWLLFYMLYCRWVHHILLCLFFFPDTVV